MSIGKFMARTFFAIALLIYIGALFVCDVVYKFDPNTVDPRGLSDQLELQRAGTLFSFISFLIYRVHGRWVNPGLVLLLIGISNVLILTKIQHPSG
ncbi:hypothetical protein ACFZBU_15105 [Embleya sp. NPDC008237]|uniref:hypothetical protein n=1 Tax=Embleya sp. NPDC008237 TaxID=3363978 RepID=UPI0036EA2B97